MWTEQQLKKLMALGKIRGFRLPPPEKRKAPLPPKHTSKAKDWIGQVLPAWATQKKIKLETEYQFNPNRKWRFDWCLPELMIAIEFEGGIYQEKSGHKTAKHYTKDTMKYNSAQARGWKVFRFTALNYLTLIPQLEECISN